MIYNRGRKNNKKISWQGKDKKKDKEEIDPCFHYMKPKYLIVYCPAMKTKASRSKKPHNKSAIKATWDNSGSESEEEVDTADVW